MNNYDSGSVINGPLAGLITLTLHNILGYEHRLCWALNPVLLVASQCRLVPTCTACCCLAALLPQELSEAQKEEAELLETQQV